MGRGRVAAFRNLAQAVAALDSGCAADRGQLWRLAGMRDHLLPGCLSQTLCVSGGHSAGGAGLLDSSFRA